jgi:hypothetical protein
LKSFSKKSIETQWTCALAETGICPIYNCEDKTWHVPPNRPLFKELHLKLEVIPSSPAAQLAAQRSTDPPTLSPPSHGGRALGADESLAGGSSSSGHAPSCLLVSISGFLLCVVMEYDSDDDICWAGGKNGFDYGVAFKDKSPLTGYVPSGHFCL